MYKQVSEKFEKAIELGACYYNLACLNTLISYKDNALFYLNNNLANKEIEIDYVKKDKDWKNYLEDENFKEKISLYSTS